MAKTPKSRPNALDLAGYRRFGAVEPAETSSAPPGSLEDLEREHAQVVRKIIEANAPKWSRESGAKMLEDSKNGFYLHLVFASPACADAFVAWCTSSGVEVDQNIIVDGNQLASKLGVTMPPASVMKPARLKSEA